MGVKSLEKWTKEYTRKDEEASKEITTLGLQELGARRKCKNKFEKRRKKKEDLEYHTQWSQVCQVPIYCHFALMALRGISEAFLFSKQNLQSSTRYPLCRH